MKCNTTYYKGTKKCWHSFGWLPVHQTSVQHYTAKLMPNKEAVNETSPLVNYGILNFQCYHSSSKVLNKHINSFYPYKILLYKHFSLMSRKWDLVHKKESNKIKLFYRYFKHHATPIEAAACKCPLLLHTGLNEAVHVLTPQTNLQNRKHMLFQTLTLRLQM